MNKYALLKLQFICYCVVFVCLIAPFLVTAIFTIPVIIDCFREHYQHPDSWGNIYGKDVVVPVILIDAYAFAFFKLLLLNNKIIASKVSNNYPISLHYKNIGFVLPIFVGLLYIYANIRGTYNWLFYYFLIVFISSICCICINAALAFKLLKRKIVVDAKLQV